jgi:hypothetical protein
LLVAHPLNAQTVPPPSPPEPPALHPPSVLKSVGKVLTAQAPARFTYKVAPGTAPKLLLPLPPKFTASVQGPVLSGELALVPEAMFAQPLDKKMPSDKARHAISKQIINAAFLNEMRTDGFMETLVGERGDLSGLPLAMGDACRMKEERSKQFKIAVDTIRAAQGGPTLNVPVLAPATQATALPPSPPPAAPPNGFATTPPPPSIGTQAVPNATADTGEAFWERLRQSFEQADRDNAKADKQQREHVTPARMAALMQILGPQPTTYRLGLVKYLTGVTHPEATRALAKLAIFSAEDEVRNASIDALRVRREKDYAELLMGGLRYPWPAVAKRAAEVLVKLDRQDVIPQLVDLLDEPDPREPLVQKVKDEPVTVVRELVKVNHHRNCLLCHSPADPQANVEGLQQVSLPDMPIGPIPIPGEPMLPPSQGYQRQPQDLLVRVDVTYLRQDFSMMLPVSDAHPWPTMQRFDFMVRTRAVSDDEAEVYREKLAKSGSGAVTPYERAILFALRELTGRDTEPTAAAWRRLLSP